MVADLLEDGGEFIFRDQAIHHSLICLLLDSISLIASLNKLQFSEITYVQVVFVMTGDCGDNKHEGYQVFEEIASTSSGQVYHINKTDVEEVCESQCLSRTVGLATGFIPVIECCVAEFQGIFWFTVSLAIHNEMPLQFLLFTSTVLPTLPTGRSLKSVLLYVCMLKVQAF